MLISLRHQKFQEKHLLLVTILSKLLWLVSTLSISNVLESGISIQPTSLSRRTKPISHQAKKITSILKMGNMAAL